MSNTSIEIIPYEPTYQQAFKALNLEWLERYNLLEQIDMDMLNDPEKYILNDGGYIFLARLNNEIIGTAGLVKEHNNTCELVKMCVHRDHRAKGISKLLIEACISQARELGVERIVLFSNHQLQAAQELYKQYGFNYVTLEDSYFVTADIKMELKI
ncbi:GNAT family N-acetyltransferase [Ohtaekwangia kribbensis]|jgi:N-acetylglutamate synthase-like GNAT family acetyltransferase|uniref:GNAT family N-acetyltransferase n=1 Tax=Ohtaekwangia kribbensis TaxID=688913 RepID=A0ABW3KAL4_9BACT